MDRNRLNFSDLQLFLVLHDFKNQNKFHFFLQQNIQ